MASELEDEIVEIRSGSSGSCVVGCFLCFLVMVTSSVVLVCRSGFPPTSREVLGTGSSNSDRCEDREDNQEAILCEEDSTTPVPTHFVPGCLVNAPTWIEDPGANLFVVGTDGLRRVCQPGGSRLRAERLHSLRARVRTVATCTRGTCGVTRGRRPKARRKRTCSPGAERRTGALEKAGRR